MSDTRAITNGDPQPDEELDDVEVDEPEIVDDPSFNDAQRRLAAQLTSDAPAADVARMAMPMGQEGIDVLVAAATPTTPMAALRASDVAGQLQEPMRTIALIALMGSDSLDARIESAAALETRWDPTAPDALEKLMALVTGSDDPGIRGRAAKIAATSGDAGLLQPLNVAARGEAHVEARQGIDLALARLGDAPARQRHAVRLTSPDVPDRVEAVQDYIYIDDPVALPALFGTTSDTANAINLRPAHAPGDYWLRVCDIAAEVIWQVGQPRGAQLSFHPFRPARERRTDAQLNEVRNYLRRLAPSTRPRP